MPKTKQHAPRLRPVVPDRIDLRDRLYLPPIAEAPRQDLSWQSQKGFRLPVLDQGETNACTGFALANVVHFLLMMSGRRADGPVAPYMLYSMARRYDEFPGASSDTGSSLRGALKGWYKHGAAAARLWPEYEMPPANPSPAKDWWADAARRPLGAYYRIDTRSVTDMHVALNDGVLYASAVCHAGWDEGYDLPRRQAHIWTIPSRKVQPDDGGHAFVIVGYNREGFLLLNSWGTGWGTHGLAVLPYEDWLDNAMDCWIAQIGVVTDQHREVAAAATLRTEKRPRGPKVSLASDPSLRNHEISPFVVDMGNNGQLSSSGAFRTNEDDLRWLVSHHLETARERWGIGDGPIDVAVYAHGGLVGEEGAAKTAARWIPALYDARIFPVFFMWETDIFSTLKGRFADLILGEPKPTGGVRDLFLRFWNQRLERLLSKLGTFFWDEMKQNAQAISATFEDGSKGGGRLLFAAAREVPGFRPERVRLHLIGHSAGAIVHCHLADALVRAGWPVESVSFMAPACRTDLFLSTIGPALRSGMVRRYTQFHLSDEQEQRDPTCLPIMGYGRSLLYLVSQSFENGEPTPILGMQKYFEPQVVPRRLPNTRAFATPSTATQSSTHPGFDEDTSTMSSVIASIAGKVVATGERGRRTGSRRPGTGAGRRGGGTRRRE